MKSVVDFIIESMNCECGKPILTDVQIGIARLMFRNSIQDAYRAGYEHYPIHEIAKSEQENPIRLTPKKYYEKTFTTNE